MTAALKAIAGSAASPSITFTSDATTGLFLPSSGSLGLSSNGVLALTLNSAQVAAFAQSAYAKNFMVIDTADASASSNINTLATAGTGAIAIGTSTNWSTNGYLICDNEIMSYTVASANGLTINARGLLGTTSLAHATASTITMLYSAISARDVLLPARTTANRPSSPSPGDFGFNTGSGQPEVYNGTLWASIAQPAITPQGYLTPTSGVPILTTSATSQGTIYYTPYFGSLIPVPVAGVFTTQLFTEAAIVLSSSQVTGGIYDIAAFLSTAGALTFGISPSWAAGTSGSVTAGACARGTSTGGTALTRTNGFYVNATTEAYLNGATSYTIATASSIYLGSIYVNATAGSLNFTKSIGQSRLWGAWNAFNRNTVSLSVQDATASWAYATATWRQSDADTGNAAALFCGLPEEPASLLFAQTGSNSGANPISIGLGINGSTAGVLVGKTGKLQPPAGASTSADMTAFYEQPPALGLNNITCLESGNATGGAAFTGSTSMLMTVRWRA